jgi:hypothetical protein
MIFEVHPAADPWPMMPEDELVELADSIRAVGLLEPLVLTPDGMLLDGRNRLDACVRAGVAPTTIVYDGDQVAFVLARNAHRRHMSSGQRATAAWLTACTSPAFHDETPASVRGVAAVAAVDVGSVGKAKVVADKRPDLLPEITSGAMTLPVAYAKARGVEPPPPAVASIRRFLAGWTTFVGFDELPDRDAVLAALTDDERRTLNEIRSVMR